MIETIYRFLGFSPEFREIPVVSHIAREGQKVTLWVSVDGIDIHNRMPIVIHPGREMKISVGKGEETFRIDVVCCEATND